MSDTEELRMRPNEPVVLLKKRRLLLYGFLASACVFVFILTILIGVTQREFVPKRESLEIKIYSLNNWAIPANPDKEERLNELKKVLAKEEFDFFLLQGLWMNYDHTSIKEALPKGYFITDFRELAESVCDGRVSRFGCSGLSIIYKHKKVESNFYGYTYRGSIYTTDGTLWKGVGQVRFNIKGMLLDIFITHLHDSEIYYQELQSIELMTYVAKSPADVVILGSALQASPSSKPYIHVMNGYPYGKIYNVGECFDVKNWDNANKYGTFDRSTNKYREKSSKQKIFDFLFVGNTKSLTIDVQHFGIADFNQTLKNLSYPLSSHETLELSLKTVQT